MRAPRRALSITIVLPALAAGACDEPLADIAGPSSNLTPTFSSIRQNIFESTDAAGRTACVACHTTINRVPPAGMDLGGDAFGSLVNARSTGRPGAIRVIPGDPENSYLIQKLEGRPGITGLRMPFNGPPYLTEGQIRIIKRWIELGARND